MSARQKPTFKIRSLLDAVAYAGISLNIIKTFKGSVFISYRRSDQAALAGRLYEKIVAKTNPYKVFVDVDSRNLGLDFVEVINNTLSQCRVMLVVIGNGWLNARDEHGNRRLDNPDDIVRIEIEKALGRNIRIIPILVDGTPMPQPSQLPDSIKALARRSGRDVSNATFGSDSLELVNMIYDILIAD